MSDDMMTRRKLNPRSPPNRKEKTHYLYASSHGTFSVSHVHGAKVLFPSLTEETAMVRTFGGLRVYVLPCPT